MTQFKIRYFKSHDFKTVLVTGVFGGIQSNGLINADFFVDRVLIPDFQTLEIDETKNLIKETTDAKDGHVAREIQCGIMMDISTAKVLVEWLNSKIKEAEDIRLKTLDK